MAMNPQMLQMIMSMISSQQKGGGQGGGQNSGITIGYTPLDPSSNSFAENNRSYYTMGGPNSNQNTGMGGMDPAMLARIRLLLAGRGGL